MKKIRAAASFRLCTLYCEAYQLVEVGQIAKLIKAKYKIKLNVFLKTISLCFRNITTLHIKIR